MRIYTCTHNQDCWCWSLRLFTELTLLLEGGLVPRPSLLSAFLTVYLTFELSEESGGMGTRVAGQGLPKSLLAVGSLEGRCSSSISSGTGLSTTATGRPIG